MKKGFTLIELLVVIAIIGLLSGIALGSFAQARDNARVANIKANLHNAIVVAEVHRTNTGSYVDLCNQTELQSIMSAIEGIGAMVACYVHPSDQTLQRDDWGISAYLNENAMFSVNPQGVVTFDTEDTTGSQAGDSVNWTTTAWDANMGPMPHSGAVEACINQGKHLPSVSQLKALDLAWVNAGNDWPLSGFVVASYWTSVEHSETHAWRVDSMFGGLGPIYKLTGFRVRCVS